MDYESIKLLLGEYLPENLDLNQNSGRLIKNHFDRILNYFRTRLTNGYAEGLNSRIQRIISSSRGFKNTNFMIYRIIKIFG